MYSRIFTSMLNVLQEEEILWGPCLFKHQACIENHTPPSTRPVRPSFSPAVISLHPLWRNARPTIRTVLTWPDGELSYKTFTEMVLNYINFCIRNVKVDNKVWIFPTRNLGWPNRSAQHSKWWQDYLFWLPWRAICTRGQLLILTSNRYNTGGQ